ncbi:MAG: hypothetical protein RLZZ383_2912, partial [Pseudomonadota bacterium]
GGWAAESPAATGEVPPPAESLWRSLRRDISIGQVGAGGGWADLATGLNCRGF